MQWFDVSKAGLAKLLERRGKEFVVLELIQNAWDEDTHEVRVTLKRIEGTRSVRLVVEDDNPNGFVDLSHAFTLFAESTKKNDVNKRGRFNLGEKLVLALCEEAEIASTKGTIEFDASGRHTRRAKRESGSVFTGTIRMTQEEIERCGNAIHSLLPPNNIATFYNDEPIAARRPITTLNATLATESADFEGYLRKTSRKTNVEIHEPLAGETAMLYELGIPVVETGDRWHVNVMQKVPLTVDRDNVPPSYLSLIRSLVVDHMREHLTLADANSPWVKQALCEHGEDLNEDTITRLVDLRFGPKRVAYDPSDPEANSLAISKDYVVVHGPQMSKEEWQAVKRTGAILPAGQVTPSPKPFSPDGKPLSLLPREKWTASMKRVVAYIETITPRLTGATVSVQITDDAKWPFAAAYGKTHPGHGDLHLSLPSLGYEWFMNLERINDLLIHELGHYFCGDHLNCKYHEGLTLLGAKLTQLALNEPHLFDTVRQSIPETLLASKA